MFTGVTISFVSFAWKYNGAETRRMPCMIETVITSHKFENPMGKDDPDLEKYINDVTELFYSCDKIKFTKEDEVIVLRDIQKRNGFFKITLDKED